MRSDGCKKNQQHKTYGMLKSPIIIWGMSSMNLAGINLMFKIYPILQLIRQRYKITNCCVHIAVHSYSVGNQSCIDHSSSCLWYSPGTEDVEAAVHIWYFVVNLYNRLTPRASNTLYAISSTHATIMNWCRIWVHLPIRTLHDKHVIKTKVWH